MDFVLVALFLFALFFLSVPIFIALFITTFISFHFISGVSLIVIGQDMFSKINSYTLLAVLFFITAGNIMGSGKISEKLINFAHSLVGWLQGGLAITGVVANGLFGAISGAATPTLVAIGSLMFPSLRKKGYRVEFTTGIITSSAMLGIIIPPSIPMIFYAMVADVSVGKIFAAGFVPGIILVLVFAIYSAVYAKKTNIQKVAFKGLGHVWFSIKDGILALFLPLLVFVGIFGGIFSPTEAGAVAVVYAFLVEFLVYRDLKIKDIWNIVLQSSVVTATFLVIVAAASTFTDFLAMEQVPIVVTNAVSSIIESPWAFLIFVNLLLLIVGTFIDVLSAIVLLAPILMPLATQFGIDPVHFGVIMIFNLGVGYITPPLGLNLFVSSAMTNEPIYQVSKAVMPFFLLLLISLLIISYAPALIMYIPNLFYP